MSDLAQPKLGGTRPIARIIGIIYLLGFVVGIIGITLINSVLDKGLAGVGSGSLTLAIGAVLWLFAAAGDAAHGILMYPILAKNSERLAVGYLAFRILDALLVAVMVLFVLVQIPIGQEYTKAAADAANLQVLSYLFTQAQEYAYEIAMVTLGVSGVFLCTTLLRAKLLPKWLCVWGLVGYVVIFFGMISAIMGSGLADASSAVGGLWELFVGIWLIAKGFNVTAAARMEREV